MKCKEKEDEIELRRMRTENSLLRQRIEMLETESSDLADRLIQGQVTRAEVEEILRCVTFIVGIEENRKAFDEGVPAADLQKLYFDPSAHCRSGAACWTGGDSASSLALSDQRELIDG